MEGAAEIREERKKKAAFENIMIDLVHAQRTCKKCELHKSRKNVVTYRGVLKKGVVMFVGEAPGMQEDYKGRPFVGSSGQLLDEWLNYSGLTEYYITNIVRCRPPNNRIPTKEEREACWYYLEETIGLLEPICIVAVGRTAQAVFEKKEVGVPVIFIYHPSYLLRMGSKREQWEPMIDKMMEKICKVMENA